MAGILKPPPPPAGSFALTPHKLSLCILLQSYTPPPSHLTTTFPFSSAAQHNLLGLFLFCQTNLHPHILEPPLDLTVDHLKKVNGLETDWLVTGLVERLGGLTSADDLFDFFGGLRGVLEGGDGSGNVMDDYQIVLDPSSVLGLFVRRCLVAFNSMSFEGVCHLLSNVEAYCRESRVMGALKLSNLEGGGRGGYDKMDFEGVGGGFVEDLDMEPIMALRHAGGDRGGGRSRFSDSLKGGEGLVDDLDMSPIMALRYVGGDRGGVKSRLSYSLKRGSGFVEDLDMSPIMALKHGGDRGEVKSRPSDSLKESGGGVFLRTHWQIQGYLAEQADAIEKNGSSFLFNELESVLKQLQKLAPELHRVHFLRYLNNAYHDDYPAALENLHRYFDYSAGIEGFECGSPSLGSLGRYEIALLCLGMMQLQFGHPKQSLEVLTEAVRVSQQHGDDTYLAYTLAAICNLLFESGVSKTTGVIGSSYCPMESIGNSLSTQQQLYVLLRRSLKRAESLKLKQLVASSHLAMAKFHMTHVQRPLLSFGPKASTKLSTCPADVCKELRLTSHLIKEVGEESSVMTADGAFSTAWIKNMKKSSGSLVFSPENASSGDIDFCAQPSTIPASVMQLIGSSYLVRATSWEVYGSASLARMNALVFATCLSDSSSSADKALAYAKLIQNVAVFKGYQEAFSALKIAEERFLCVSKSRILLLKLQLLHERALHRGHLKLAQQLCDEFGVLTSPVTGVDMDLKTQTSLRHARTLLAANQFSQAASVAHSLFSWCYKFNLQVENAAVLLLLAEIHKRSGNAVLGIPYALASLSFCQSFNLDLLKASATLTLAELWLSLGPHHAKRALALVHSALPKLLGHGGLELCARAFITEAKCYLAEPGLSVAEDPEIVLDSLRQASDGLELLEYHELASEAYYLMAVMYDKLGKFEDREKAAASFKNHMVALEDPVDDQDPLFNML
ncbi:hypothetical protein Leryth_002955 [Lithospermum erythrorhizon]|nr:hypothetical protein Leryth_002955 [Lithospermum erythrorhizon]